MDQDAKNRKDKSAKDTKEKKYARKMLIDYITSKISGEKTDVGDLTVSLISVGVSEKEEDISIVMPETSYHVTGKEQLLGSRYYIPEVNELWLDAKNDGDVEIEDVVLAVASEHLMLVAGEDKVMRVFDNRLLAMEYYNNKIENYLNVMPDDGIAQKVAKILDIIN